MGTTLIKDPVEMKEQRGILAADLGVLNADQRAALVLVDMEGYSVEEAARNLGCAPGTVKSGCARGRARLLPLLSHLKAEEGSWRAPSARAVLQLADACALRQHRGRDLHRSASTRPANGWLPALIVVISLWASSSVLSIYGPGLSTDRRVQAHGDASGRSTPSTPPIWSRSTSS
jgi:hypothetical protein